MVLIFSDLNKTQIYKMPCRVSSHDELEILMNFKYLNVFKPNEQAHDYYNRKPNDEIFLFEIGDKKLIYVGEKVLSFEKNDIIFKKISELLFQRF